MARPTPSLHPPQRPDEHLARYRYCESTAQAITSLISGGSCVVDEDVEISQRHQANEQFDSNKNTSLREECAVVVGNDDIHTVCRPNPSKSNQQHNPKMPHCSGYVSTFSLQ